MALSTDVNLSKTHVPDFPDRCVDCGQPRPGCVIRVCTNAIGWRTIAFWTFGRRFCVDVPACVPCRRRMIRQRQLSRAITLGVAVVGVCVAGYLLAAYRGPFRRWLAMGIALVCMLPLVLWEMFFPPAIDLTAYSETVDYEFQNPDYAAEFAALNGGVCEGDEG